MAPDDFDTGNAGDGGFTAGGVGNEEAGEPASSDWMKDAAANSGAVDDGRWGGKAAW